MPKTIAKEVKSSEIEPKDLNETALEKVEEKFNEQNKAQNGPEQVLVTKENYDALVLLFQGENGELPPDVFLEAIHKIRELNDNKENSEKLAVTLIGIGWDGTGSAVAAARELILRHNSDLQVLDSALIANGIKEPDAVTHPIEAAVMFFNNYKPLAIEVPPEGRQLAPGTSLQIGGETVTLAHKTIVNYPDEQNEAKFVGLCHHSNNLGVNQQNLRFRYNGLGVRLPLDEQVDDPSQLPEFIANLTENEANSFGISDEEWLKHQDKD